MVLPWLILTILVLATVTAWCLPAVVRLREARGPARPPAVRGARRTGPCSALILYGAGGDELVHALAARGVRTVLRSADHLAVDILGNVARIHEQVTQRDLADFGLVHIRDHRLPPGLLSTISCYLSAHRCTLVNGDSLGGARSGLAAPSRLHQYVKLALFGENVPDTVHLPASRLGPSFDMLAARFGTPFVLKPMYACAGELTRLIGEDAELAETLRDRRHRGLLFLAQRYVPNNGTFLIWVLGAEVRLVIHRCSTDGSQITSRAGASHTTLFEPDGFDDDVKRTAVRCADLFGYDIAAVTVVQDRVTRLWYVLGVNGSPAIGEGPFSTEVSRVYADFAARRLRADVPSVTREGRRA